MIFNSLTYLTFLTIVVMLYWLLPSRQRILLLFLSNMVFYAFWKVEFIPLLLFSTFIGWWIPIRMTSCQERNRYKLMVLGIVINLGLLAYFKYLIFFAHNATGLANFLGFQIDPFFLNIILPLGISFYTFQTISYTVDVYRSLIKPEQDFIIFACYVTYFPQLIAGPILRGSEIIHQFRNPAEYSPQYIIPGVRRILYGLFLKLVLADNLGSFVDTGFSQEPGLLSAIDVWTLAFLFGFQIYFDFSAYSHIALGSARLMGVNFPENFNFPYLASSPKDFWRRWHISLSSWIRDYLYLPLLGATTRDRSIGGLPAMISGKLNAKALYLTWAIMGLWHGANWTFVLWGLFHATIVVAYRILEPSTRTLSQHTRTGVGIITTLPLIMLAWIPFRSEDLTQSLAMLSRIWNPSAYTWLGMHENAYLFAALTLIGIFTTYGVQNLLIPSLRPYVTLLKLFRILSFGTILALIIIFFQPTDQFIYFQF